MSSHYSGGSTYGGGGASSGSYYNSRSRDAERGRDRDRGREWRRSERDRSRGRSRERGEREKERQKSPVREARYSEYGGGRDRERRQERYGGKRYGGKHGGRFADRSSPPSTSSTGIPEVEPSSLIREKDLNAARLLGYAGNPNHYGPSYHYSSHGHYGMPTQPIKTEHKSKAKDPKSNPLFKAAVDTLVMNIKTKGDYDQIRKECFSDIDTKAAYLNLHSRIRATVDKYLNQQIYKKDMDKVKVREGMRKKILDTPYFERGIESVVNQILTPKIASLIRPKIEEEVYKYLNIKKGGGAHDTALSSAGPIRQEVEVEFKNVISTKEFSFHDITTAVKERKVKPPTSTPPPRPVPTTPSSESDKESEDEREAKESDDDSDSESSEGIATPLYSPAGKTPMADEDDDDEEYDRPFADDNDNEESKGSLQIDEFAETNKSTEVESKVISEESESEPEPEARTPTPTLPEGSISPIVPRKESPAHLFSDEAAFVPAASAYIVKDHLAQLTLSQIHSPPPSTKIDVHNSPEVPPRQYIAPFLPSNQYTAPLPPQSPTVENENVPPLPPSSPQKSQFPHPPPPDCDDTACSSPPPPENQRSEVLPFSTSNQQPSDAEEQNDSGEPLPPGEEPEGYFIQMRQKMEDKKNMQERPPSPMPLQSDITPTVHEEENADEEEEVEEDSEEESPMFEKVGEVSPPRPLELHNSELAHELTKELLGQAQAASNAELLSELTGSVNQNTSENSADNNNEIPPEITPDDPPETDSDAPPETESDKYCKFLEPIPDYEFKMNYYRRFRDAT